jgi:hypothetical protein
MKTMHNATADSRGERNLPQTLRKQLGSFLFDTFMAQPPFAGNRFVSRDGQIALQHPVRAKISTITLQLEATN